MRPPRARTWGKVGRTPEVRVRGRGGGRVSMAELSCFKSGRRSRMFYSFHVYRGRKGEKKGLTWQDFRDLLIRTHIQLGGPIVLVWDNLRAHLTPPMRQFIEASKDWLTVFQLPSYAPDLNPQEGIWSLVKRTIGNLAAANLNQLAQAVKRSLKKIQYRPWLIDGCLAATGLIMDG
ncbi:transposase [Kitasatospora sp. NBC_01560]|uniref:transposase n=1 Tax=Kitasatospora sp. NBC_01560 TaxID=2975965 RepID=UPI0038669D46